jgi:hypothetical protein
MGFECPQCGDRGECAGGGTRYDADGWPIHMIFYRCPSGHSWSFPPFNEEGRVSPTTKEAI